jgi:hypothetical protein
MGMMVPVPAEDEFMSGLCGGQAGPRRFFGSRVVAAAFVLAVFGWGVGFYGPPVFLEAVIDRTGWSVGFVSGVVTVHFLSGALVVAKLPLLYGRFGLPRVTSAGAVLLAAGILGWSLAAEPWQLVAAALLSGAGWVAMGAAALNAIISPWFVRRRPAALSTAYNGASIGGVVMSPLWAVLIAGHSFTAAAALVGGVMVCAVLLMSHAVFSKTPEQLGQRPDGDAPDAGGTAGPDPLETEPLPVPSLWRDRAFLTLASGMALGLFAQIGVIAHLFSLLVPALGERWAGFAMALATACAVGGRVLVGRAMPAGADRRLVACLSYGLQVIGSLFLLASGGRDIPLLLAGIVLFGAGIGNATSLPPLVAQKEFSGRDVRRVVPLIVAIGQAAYAFAPAAFGLLRGPASPIPGSPWAGAALFAAAALIQAGAIALFLAGRHRPAQRGGLPVR